MSKDGTFTLQQYVDYMMDLGVPISQALIQEAAEIEAATKRLKRLIPEQSTGCYSKYGGECLACGGTFKKDKMLYRLLRADEDGKIRGQKICTGCSPHISDEIVHRYTLEMDDWEGSWLNHLDSNTQVFNDRVVCINN